MSANQASLIVEIGREYNDTLHNLSNIGAASLHKLTAHLRRTAEREGWHSLLVAADRLEHFAEFGIQSINVGGTMGSGKSSVANALADRLGWELKDADHFHPLCNREKMARGISLTSEDRKPFLNAVQSWLRSPRQITTCSALTDLYRAVIAGQDVNALSESSLQIAPWDIPKPNLGLLQVIVYKPYDTALEQLDRAVKLGPPRLFDGRPHFIQVTFESEARATSTGAVPLLQSQYALLESSAAMPWDVVTVMAEDSRMQTGEYDLELMIKPLADLPYNKKED